MLALVGTVMSRSASGNVLLRDGDDVLGTHRVPDGGGWRLHGGEDNPDRETHRGRGIGYDYLHVAADDRTRLAYVEAHPDERDPIAAGFLHRACAWFATH